MDVSADDPIAAAGASVAGDALFKATDEAGGLFDPALDGGRQGPVLEAQPAPGHVEDHVDRQQGVVGDVTQVREPPGLADRGVELIAMHDQHALPVGGGVDELISQVEPAVPSQVVAEELVVIARGVKDLGSFVNQFAYPLEEGRVGFVPVPAPPQLPPVDDVAHEVEVFRLRLVKKIEEGRRLGVAAAQVGVADEHGTHVSHGLSPAQVQFLAVAGEFTRPDPRAAVSSKSPRGSIGYGCEETMIS